jgi:anti-sigma factor RsiW
MTNKPHETELHAYIDGELDEEARARVEAWLATHPLDRERVAAYHRHKILVRTCLEQTAEPDGREAETDRLVRTLAARLERTPRWPSLGQIAAGLAIFVAGALTHPAHKAYQEWRIPPVVEAAAQAHEVFGDDPVRPVELAGTSKREMAAWLADHLGEEVQVPDLTFLGHRLVAGRLLSSATGPMAQLLYEDRLKRRMTIYLSAQDTGSGSHVEVVKVASVSAGYWKDGDITYTVVAEMESDALFEVASEINGAMAQTLF